MTVWSCQIIKSGGGEQGDDFNTNWDAFKKGEERMEKRGKKEEKEVKRRWKKAVTMGRLSKSLVQYGM